MNLAFLRHPTILRQELLTLPRVVVFLAVLLILPNAATLAAGMKLQLQMLPTGLTSATPDRSEVGLSQSRDSIPLLKSDLNQSKLTGVYDQKSRLLVLSQLYGRFSNVKVAAPVAPDAYRNWLLDSQNRRMWREGYQALAKKTSKSGGGSLLQFELPFKPPKAIKSIMGEGGAGLKVNGSHRITFSGRSQWSDQASVATVKQSKFPSLNMEQVSSFNIGGNIGSKIFVDVRQDSRIQQPLANRIQLRYKGEEDDVIKTVELGNTNLSLPGARFIGYSRQIQGLFGIKTTAELGGLRLTAIASQEKSANKSASFRAGATDNPPRILRDYQYLDMTYFDLTRRDQILSPADLDIGQGDSITYLELYYSINAYDERYTNAQSCSLFVDPFNKDKYSNETTGGKYISWKNDPPDPRMGTYIPNYTQHYILVERPLSSISIGAYIRYKRPGESVEREIGHLSGQTDSTTILKLIVHHSPDPNLRPVTWNYVWRNVYSLGARIDNLDALTVQIYRGDATNAQDRNAADLYHQKGQNYINLLGLDSDNNGQIDAFNAQIVDPWRGHIRFPSRRPFMDSVLDVQVPEIYNTPATSTDRTTNSKYYLVVNSSIRQSEFSLGHGDIVPESETVTLNGQPLKKGSDYQISYDLGTITFINQEALKPNADVKVDFEYAPFITAEKKTLLGVRGEYEVGKRFKMGATALYKSEKATDRKPRLGEEQSKFLNLDTDLSYSFESMLLTKMIDAFPLIKTSAPSSIRFGGEVAQSVPNANVKGEAFLDDFEGARERYPIGIAREGWRPASPPMTIEPSFTPQAKLIWYNPYEQVRVTEIYDREVRAGEDRTHVLVLRHVPDSTNRQESWNGIMKALSAGAFDQSKTEFIELRMKGREGKLHIDLGEITEDVNHNDSLDTEDRLPLRNGSPTRDGILETEEDVGLDRMPDAEERVECQCQLADPHGDNWTYDSKSLNNYEQINGTEGNGKDPGSYGRPDTEDLNANGLLDTRDNYLSYNVDLSQNDYVVPNSERNGWYTLRIPFQDFPRDDPDTTVGTPSRRNIPYVRLWLDGVGADTTWVQIADFELTRNIWEKKPLLPADRIRDYDADFKIAVANTEENRDYSPPPGVSGYFDKTTGLREKEQSLSLIFSEFAPGDTGIAEKIPYRVQDLSGYRKLELWAHGDSIRDSVLFFFRFGPDKSNFYEYFATIDSGWSSKMSVAVFFDEITQVKLKLQELQKDSSSLMEHHEGNYRVVGNPSLTRVKYFAVGVTNIAQSDSTRRQSGELWVDEFRATNVRNDRGIAASASTTIGLGDLASVSLSYNRQDAFYRTLTEGNRNNLGGGNKSTGYSFSFSGFSLDRFLPASEGARIPISYSWSRSQSDPRLFPGSDILVPPELVEAQRTVSTSSSFSISESWAKKTNNILYAALLNRFNSSFAYRKSNARNPNQPVIEGEGYTFRGQYSVTSPLKKGLRVFSWLAGMPLVPKRVLATEFNPIPNRLSLNGDVDRTYDYTQNSIGTATTRYQRTLRGRFETAFTPLNSMDASFNFDTDRDLSDPELVSFSLNPAKAKLGKERRYNQSFAAKYSPQILPFVTGTSLNFSATHGENMNVQSTNPEEATTRRVDNGRSLTAGATLNLQKLLGTNPAPPAKPKKPPKTDGQGKETSPKLDSLRGKEGKEGKAKTPPPDSLKRLETGKDTVSQTPDSLKEEKGEKDKPTLSPPDSTRPEEDTGKGDARQLEHLSALMGGQIFLISDSVVADASGEPDQPGDSTGSGKGETKPPVIPPAGTGDSTAVVPDSLKGKVPTSPFDGRGVIDKRTLEKGKKPPPDSLKGQRDTTGVIPDSLKGGTGKQQGPKAKSKPFYGPGLRLLRFFTDRIDPVIGSYRWDKRAALNGYTERPSFFYRLGLSDDPRADRVRTSGISNQIDQLSTGRGYTLKSGAKLLFGLKVSAGWAFSTNEVSGRPTRDESLSFPDLAFTLPKIDFLMVPKLLCKSFTLDPVKYSRRQNKTVNTTTGYLKARSTAVDYSPLVSVRMEWKFPAGVQTTLSYSKSMSDREDFNDIDTVRHGPLTTRSKDFRSTMTVKTNYSFRGGSKIWLPLFGRMKIQSNLSFNLDVSRSTNRTESHNPNQEPTVTNERKDFSVQPSLSYAFSTNITGGMNARWQDSNDLRQKRKTHMRELQFWVDIKF